MENKISSNEYKKAKGQELGNLGNGNAINYPWKIQSGPNVQTLKMNGHTPTRVNKNVVNNPNFDINQFTTNPTPPVSAKLGQKAVLGGGYPKSTRVNYP